MGDASESATSANPQVCPLCETPVAPDALQCPECGLYQQLGRDRPNPFRANALWTLIGSVAAVYILVLLLVLAAR